MKLSRTPGEVGAPAPSLGEHTDEVLAEAGYSAEEIAALKESGAAAGLAEDTSGARSWREQHEGADRRSPTKPSSPRT